jgi:hypothetical protein
VRQAARLEREGLPTQRWIRRSIGAVLEVSPELNGGFVAESRGAETVCRVQLLAMTNTLLMPRGENRVFQNQYSG